MSSVSEMQRRRAKRALALMALYMLDARGDDEEDIRRWAMTTEDFGQETEESVSSGGRGWSQIVRAMRTLSPAQREEAFDLALHAHRCRREADAEALQYAPEWPAYRQPALDRAIMRLAWQELREGALDPRIVINEAVELAKRFGGERSSGFVNAVLDRVAKGRASDACGAPATERAR